MITITEATALRQAKQIFNNTSEQVDEHLIEECLELAKAVKSGKYVDVIDETADVLYMINQKLSLMNTDILAVLKLGIAKNEKKRKNGSNTI